MAKRDRKRRQKKAASRAAAPTISLAMIAKNEADNLAECLESVQGIVDEIVLVDTGSEDNTVEIARSFGARVPHFKWRHDFAAARNRAVRECAGDWLLILDADERLDPHDRQEIRCAVTQPGIECCFLRIKNVTKSGPIEGSMRAIRLIRNRPGFRYLGRIHEQPVLPAKARGIFCDATIVHRGYDPEIYHVRGKKARNDELLEMGLRDTKDGSNPFLRSLYLYYYAMRARGEKRFRRLEDFAQLVDQEEEALGSRLPWILSGIIAYAIEARNRGRHDDAGNWARRLLARYGEAPLLHALIGNALLQEDRVDEAWAELQLALAHDAPLAEIHHSYPLAPGLPRRFAKLVLAEWLERQDRWLQAEDTYRELLPQLEAVRPRLALAQLRLGKHREAFETLAAGPPPDRAFPDQACLGLILSLLLESKAGLLLWGEKVRLAARTDPLCASVLRRIETRPLGQPFRPDDFPELEQLPQIPEIAGQPAEPELAPV